MLSVGGVLMPWRQWIMLFTNILTVRAGEGEEELRRRTGDSAGGGAGWKGERGAGSSVARGEGRHASR